VPVAAIWVHNSGLSAERAREAAGTPVRERRAWLFSRVLRGEQPTSDNIDVRLSALLSIDYYIMGIPRAFRSIYVAHECTDPCIASDIHMARITRVQNKFDPYITVAHM
jgi:hypothetical protein